MTARQLRGLDALLDATVHTTPGLPYLIIDDFPRFNLTAAEFSEVTRLPLRRISQEVAAHRLLIIPGLRKFVFPASQIAVVASWASYVSDTG